jgi:hypothetical protein
MSAKKIARIARTIPTAASLLTLTVAATIRVQHSCADAPSEAAHPLVYPYPELLARNSLHEVRLGQSRRVHLRAHSKESAETHYQRFPLHRIDVGPSGGVAFDEQ